MADNEGRQKTILLVEDDVLIAMSEKMSLEKYGYHVISAHSGEEAVNTVKHTPEIHLVLMDIDLGAGIDGTEAARQLLHIKDLPVVFLSSHMEPDIVEKTEKITSYGYVVKNSSITVLDASMKMAFKLFAATQQIMENDIKQHAMISNISDVIAIIDTDGIIRYKSPNVAKWFGWHADELVGMNCWQTVHPDDRERIQDVFQTLLEKDHSTATVEYRYHCKDGRYTPIQLTATNLVSNPAIGGVLLNYHDITDRKRAEDALRASEEKFRIAFRTSPDAVNLNRLSDGVYLDINEGFTKIMGYPPDDVIGKSSLSLNIW